MDKGAFSTGKHSITGGGFRHSETDAGSSGIIDIDLDALCDSPCICIYRVQRLYL